MNHRNYYLILGISNKASVTELKDAYRKLAKKYHPDKNNGDKHAEEFFKEIQQAYNVLSNPERRRKYDFKNSGIPNYSQPKQYTPYTGNAYQYAQQQAQERKNYTPQNKEESQKPDNSEKSHLIISVLIALILLYFIISYSIK